MWQYLYKYLYKILIFYPSHILTPNELPNSPCMLLLFSATTVVVVGSACVWYPCLCLCYIMHACKLLKNYATSLNKHQRGGRRRSMPTTARRQETHIQFFCMSSKKSPSPYLFILFTYNIQSSSSSHNSTCITELLNRSSYLHNEYTL